jgi:zinc transport system substrate-binding protein
MPKRTLVPLVVFIILFVIGAGLFLKYSTFLKTPTKKSLTDHKVRVVASFYPIYFFAERIGGERAVASSVTPSGVEPHDYEPTPQDMVNVQKSDIVFLNGGGLEAWSDNVAQNIDKKKTSVVTIGESLFSRTITEDGKDMTDPHIWLSPEVAKKMVSIMEDAYVQKDPDQALHYKTNADLLQRDLSLLDEQYRQGLASCRTKDIITSHAAFGYLASSYGLTQVPIAGLSPEAEPSAQDLSSLTDFARKNNVRFIFFESLVSPKLSQTLAHEIGAKTLVLNPLEGLTAQQQQRGDDYFQVMRENLTNLKTALECTP